MSINSNLTQEKVNHYRDRTYRFLLHLKLRNAQDAVDFVNERGFIFFWINKGIELPSLWGAVAGNRPVPNNHDDPAHITWQWKDEMLGKKCWYYGRILCRRNTIISLNLLPHFYALSPNYGEPQEDYLLDYQQGNLSQEEKAVYEAILDNGALDTLRLRKEAHLSSSESTSRFSRALDNLQRDFRILPVGIAESGAWHYSFIFDAVHHVFPELITQAHQIKRSQAMQEILRSYFLSVGVAPFNQLTRIFHWPKQDLLKILEKLVADQSIVENIIIKERQGNYYAAALLF